MHITQTQLLLAYGQFYFIYNFSPRPYPYLLDYFEVKTRYHFTPKYFNMYLWDKDAIF